MSANGRRGDAGRLRLVARLGNNAAVPVFAERRAIDAIGSTLLRSHCEEISEQVHDLLALAFRTRWMRLRVLSDVFLALEDGAAFLASEFIGRHNRCLQPKKLARARFHTHRLRATP